MTPPIHPCWSFTHGTPDPHQYQRRAVAADRLQHLRRSAAHAHGHRRAALRQTAAVLGKTPGHRIQRPRPVRLRRRGVLPARRCPGHQRRRPNPAGSALHHAYPDTQTGRPGALQWHGGHRTVQLVRRAWRGLDPDPRLSAAARLRVRRLHAECERAGGGSQVHRRYPGSRSRADRPVRKDRQLRVHAPLRLCPLCAPGHLLRPGTLHPRRSARSVCAPVPGHRRTTGVAAKNQRRPEPAGRPRCAARVCE
ncbi:hypothetical protein [Pseudomonas sp. 8 R 14]|nr:hypothetical protein [Pseudomonas sp. 8 R 14]